jgi:hypothetical protein
MLKQRMSDFIQGKISLSDLEELIEDRLFELRQKPGMSDEQQILSDLELLIHESNEGLRSQDELFETIRQASLPDINRTIILTENPGITTLPFETSFYAAVSPINEVHCRETAVLV